MTKKQSEFEKRIKRVEKKQVYESLQTLVFRYIQNEFDVSELEKMIQKMIQKATNAKINRQNYATLKTL